MLDKYSYFRTENCNDGVKLLLLNIKDKEMENEIGVFSSNKDAKEWVNLHHKNVPIQAFDLFNKSYMEVYTEIDNFLLEKFEEQRLAFLFPETGKHLEDIVFLGISFGEETEGERVITTINHHFLVDSGEKVFMSHLIVFNDEKSENEDEYSQFDTVIPLFQNGSYFDNMGDYVVELQAENDLVTPILKSGLGEGLYAKLKSNKFEEIELARFLERIDYPKMLKFKTGWKKRIKDAYDEMLRGQLEK